MNDLVVFTTVLIGALIIVLLALRLRDASIQSLVSGIAGAILGLLIGALASVSLRGLPGPWGGIVPLGLSFVLTVVVATVFVARRDQVVKLLPFLQVDSGIKPAGDTKTSHQAATSILVDTSVIIDGRIADIALAGFVPGTLIVPRFVLAELQNIADSEDAMRRGRGRRGLEVLNSLRDTKDVVVEVTDEDVSGIKEVDAKLVALAQKHGCNVLTTDYNLNRVAAIQGVRVLNVNELSNAIRPVVLPGEELLVRVVQPGKERSQGVGYLADGTMIVVENGDKLMGQEVMTEVTRVFQTVAGKMIFATPKGKLNKGENHKIDAKSNLQTSDTEGVITPSSQELSLQGNAVVKSIKGEKRVRGNRNGNNKSRRSTPSESIEDRIVQQNSL